MFGWKAKRIIEAVKGLLEELTKSGGIEVEIKIKVGTPNKKQ